MIVQARTHITESKCAPWSFSISNIFRSSLIPCVENDLYTANQIVKLSPNKVQLFSKQRLKKSAVSLIAHQFTHSKNRGIHREGRDWKKSTWKIWKMATIGPASTEIEAYSSKQAYIKFTRSFCKWRLGFQRRFDIRNCPSGVKALLYIRTSCHVWVGLKIYL